MTRADRLRRLLSLRSLDAPRWVVRSEQVALLLMREGLKHRGIGKKFGKRQGELYERFVIPYMDKGDRHVADGTPPT
jgi:hypothetical protein